MKIEVQMNTPLIRTMEMRAKKVLSCLETCKVTMRNHQSSFLE